MTHEQIIQNLEQLDDRIANINTEREHLEDQLIELCPFKPGDKVKVQVSKSRVVEYYIKGISVDWRYQYVYLFKKIKKDGSMSSQGAVIYSFIGIEKV